MPPCYDVFMRQKKSFSDEGFTLLELIVTIVAVAILAALVVLARE